MKAISHPDRFAVVLTPEPGDDPGDLEDRIHDEVLKGRRPGVHGSAVKVVVLDLDGVPDAPRWMKAAGPEVPDVNLRLALGAIGYKVARGLGLPAYFQWYATVEEALTGGV
jgi:hypothetical protein